MLHINQFYILLKHALRKIIHEFTRKEQMTKSKQDTKHKAELVSRREINRTCLGLNWRVFSFDDLIKGAPLAFYVVYVQPVVGKLEPLALQDTLTLAVDFNLYNKSDIKTRCGQRGSRHIAPNTLEPSNWFIL